jgi:hypothetical protein
LRHAGGMRFIALCLGLLTAAPAMAQSGRLIDVQQPGLGQSAPLTQPISQEPGPDVRGTAQAPLIVKELPRQRSPQEEADAKARADLEKKQTEYMASLASYTEKMFFVTLILAVAVGALAIAAFRQMREVRAVLLADRDFARSDLADSAIEPAIHRTLD